MKRLLWLLLLAPALAQTTPTAFIDLGGTSGSVPTATTLANGTHASVSLGWTQDGSASFTYQTSASFPLTGSVTIGGSQVSDSSTTGVQMATGASTNSDWHWGNANTPLSAGSVIGAAFNISSTIPATDTTHFDAVNLRGQTGSNNNFMNAMLGGDGTNRWISLECITGQDLSGSQAPISTVVGNIYHVEFIYSPLVGNVTVTGTTVTWVSGSKFDSSLLNGTAKIYIGGTATANSYTVASVNSPTSVTLVSGPANGSYTYAGASYMKTYVGWKNPTYTGTQINTQYCASPGIDIGRLDFGNAQGVQGTSGFFINWDTFLVSVGGPVSPGPSVKNCYGGGQPSNVGSAGLTTAAVQTAVTACASGGVVVLPPGTATWTSGLSTTSVSGPFTIIGQTQCTAGCTSGSEGVGLAFQDGTTLNTTSGSTPFINLQNCSATNFCRVTGLTFNNSIGGIGGTSGVLHLEGTFGQVASRVDNLHVTNTGTSSIFLGDVDGYGLIDHVLYSGNGDYAFAGLGGDFPSSGYQNWEAASDIGSNNSYILEDNNFTFLLNTSHGSVMDGYFGVKVAIRHNQITGGDGAGQYHGTDSTGSRSGVWADVYNNTFTSNGSNVGGQGAGFNRQSRGGVTLFHNNVVNGPTAWRGVELDYYRGNSSSAQQSQTYGLARPGLNWTPINIPPNSVTPNVPNPHPAAWAASHAYAAQAVVINGSNVYQDTTGACTSGGTAPTAGFGNTSNDGGCTWINVGGGTGNPPGTAGTNAGFLSTDNETPCTSGANCTRFFDTNNTGYPYRDQPCVGHGQTVSGCYQWGNTGNGQPSNYWGTDDSTDIQLNREYFNSAPTGYTSYTYPDPISGPGGSSGGSGSGCDHSYTTTFPSPPAPETPIKDGNSSDACWTNGDGGNAGGTVNTQSNLAYGGNWNGSFGDPTGLLTGTYGPTQSAQATLSVVGSDTGTHEAEIRLRSNINISAGTNTGYEVYCSYDGHYCNIARWNGPSGDYCNMWQSSGTVPFQSGDTLSASVSGSGTNVSVSGKVIRSGSTVYTIGPVTDNGTANYPDCNHGAQAGPWQSGQPGVGFWNGGGHFKNGSFVYGWVNFSATDGSQSTTNAPTFSPAGGTFGPNQTPSITSTTPGAIICYTTNGTTPATNGDGATCSIGTLLTNGSTISVSTSETVNAVAGTSSFADSTVTSATYMITGVSAVTFTPAPGSYSNPQTVMLSSPSTPGIVVCYTTDGSTPTAPNPGNGSCTHGTAIGNGGSFLLSATATVKALGTATGWNNSAVTSATYTISSSQFPAIGNMSGGMVVAGGMKILGMGSPGGGGTLCGPPAYLCSLVLNPGVSPSTQPVQLPNPIPGMGPNSNAVGNFLGANSIVTDNICNGVAGCTNPRILRVSDGGTSVSVPDPTTCGAPANFSAAADFSGNDTDLTWNSNDTYFGIAWNSQNKFCIVPFNPNTFQVLSPSAEGLSGQYYLVPSKKISWSHSNPLVLYDIEQSTTACPVITNPNPGWQPSGASLCVMKYDFTGGFASPTITKVFDFLANGNCLAGMASGGPTTGGVLTVSYDDTVFSTDESDTGAQDSAQFEVVYKIGTGCTVFNTWNTADAGIPAGTIVLPNGSQITPTYQNASNTTQFTKIHESFGHGNGTTLLFSASTCTGTNPCTSDGPYLWVIGTSQVIATQSSGHFAMGYDLYIHGASPQGQIASITTTNPPVNTFLISSSSPNNLTGFVAPPGFELHISWNNAANTNTNFIFPEWDTVNVFNGINGINGTPNNPFTSVGQDEIDGYPASSPGSAGALIHRMGHLYMSTFINNNTQFTGAYGIMTTSQTGKFATFTSDWICGVGASNGTNTPVCPGAGWQASTTYPAGFVLTPGIGVSKSGNSAWNTYVSAGSCTTSSSQQLTITSIAETGTTATITVSGTLSPLFQVGSVININGTSTAGYNTPNYTLTGVTSNTVTFTAASGLGSSTGGTANFQWQQANTTDGSCTWNYQAGPAPRNDVFIMELK